MIFLAKVHAGINPAGDERVFFFATRGFALDAAAITAIGADLGDAVVRGRLRQPANFRRDLTDGKLLFGAIRAGYGECLLENADGKLDAFSRYAFGWRAFELWCADDIGPWPSAWTQVLVATMQTVEADADVLRIRLRDKAELLARPMCPTFGGTGQLDGTSDLKGKPKPMLYGLGFNAELVPCYLAKGIWMLSHRGKAFTRGLRDKGVAYAQADPPDYNQYADWAAITTNEAFDPGTYKTWADGSLVKIGGAPDGVLTVDWRCYETAYNNSTDNSGKLGNVLHDIAIDAGLTAGEISSADVSALNTATSNVYGWRACDTSTTWLDALGQLAESGASYVGFDRLGVLRMAKLSAPSGTPAWTISPANGWDIRRVVSDEPGRGLPCWRVTVNYPRNWRVMQQSDLATSVGTQQRLEYAADYPLHDLASNAVKDQHLNATDLSFDSLSYATRTSTNSSLSANQAVDADDYLALFGVARDWIEVTVPFTVPLLQAVDLASVVRVTWPRWGLDAGKLFVVVAMRYELSGRDPFIRLTLWG